MTKKQQTVKQFDVMLKKHIDKKDFVKINRTVTDGEANISGFILKMSKDFLLVQKEEEFYLNGYAVIRKNHFDAIRCNKWDKSFKKILKAEGITDRNLGIKENISLGSWQSVFKDLKKHDYYVIVECEDLEEPLFLIGPITKITSNSVSIRNFDPSGLLDRKSTIVKYKDITLVKFGDRYINVFRKYLRTPKRK